MHLLVWVAAELASFLGLETQASAALTDFGLTISLLMPQCHSILLYISIFKCCHLVAIIWKCDLISRLVCSCSLNMNVHRFI